LSDIIEAAEKDYQSGKEGWQGIYDAGKEDVKFLGDDPNSQWDTDLLRELEESGCLIITLDQLGQFVHQVANDIRQNTPTINVLPETGGDEETAQVFKELIREIEYYSNADDVYDTASLNAIRGSIGFIRVDHEYANDTGFEQRLCIKRVVNPFACWIDPSSTECDGRDANWGLIIDTMKADKFKAAYPGKEAVSFGDEQKSRTLKSDDEIQIAEYFRKVETSKTIAMSEDGQQLEYQEGAKNVYKTTRNVKSVKIERYKLSGADVLEKTTFPGKYIPLIPVYGEEVWEDGKRKLFSLIRKSKKGQQLYNLWRTIEAHLLKNTPQAPVMAAGESLADYADDWENHRKRLALRYSAFDPDGNALPKPERLAPAQIPTGIVNAAREMVDDIKSSMGMYNASLGQKGNEISGVAIQRRQQEGDVATFHFADNLVRSITHVGRVLVSAIPEIYDTARVIRLIDVEDKTREVGINGKSVEGQERDFDLTSGQYSVRVTTGASYTTKRQEAATFLSEVVSRSPDLMAVAGDILFKSMDIPGAEALAERMEKMLPPQLKDEEGEDPEKMAMQQHLQQAQQALQAMQGQLESKQAEQQMKAQSEQQKAQLEVLKMQHEQQQSAMEFELKKMEYALKERELQLKAIEIQARMNEPKQSGEFNA
jgi:hypothetical protein